MLSRTVSPRKDRSAAGRDHLLCLRAGVGTPRHPRQWVDCAAEILLLIFPATRFRYRDLKSILDLVLKYLRTSSV
jgi:hypothetical protein